ncbi:cell division protein FtsI/penicillin-binding protein 2 [Limosilactobacillus mucosae]|uniref:peptidoglycan D,D-transpeptidase FtsI family protein n=1 Tax=Limosilactobacillus mucosae TaxID=97478 RepID=UPI000D6BEF79|nr:penicillin-binding protein 2 [Limosilactobacillus mucosae]PWJ46672.1 cell division protein FtsI/penicillin-binding protein 2 [Limosilactobacillus mucosae]RXA58077.1 penicillin-binding protein 2 [Limosilactobacillus mucosae]UNL62043.1 penicillin-binding protein 2 [Limosilactobacillus mucosae]SUQ21116.1 cell elongation-specific peptidoglycan D,D-transpeptidase [Limosilactobacillus mucosae]
MKFLNRFKGIFDQRKKSKKTAQSVIPSRLNFLLWVVALLLLALVARLFYLQVLNGSSFKAEVKSSDTTVQTNNVQRGMIYDSSGKVLVGNQVHQAITYTKGADVTSADLYKIANRLGNYVNVGTKTKLTQRQAEDYYLADSDNLKAIVKKLHLSSQVTSNGQYNKALAYLNKHPEVYKLTKLQQNKARIYAAMSGAYSLSTTYIKSTGVTAKELAEVGEHLNEMPGVKIGKAWTRNYPQGKDIQNLTGTLSSGLPSDELNSMLAQGYSRNDDVGQSYLEKLYQSTLAGSKSQTEVMTTGNTTKEKVKYAGKKGDNLVLTINSKFQKQVQSILEKNYSSAGIAYSTGVYAVVMNPNTGEIYAMAGIDRDPTTGKQTTDEIGAINHPITMGSVVKGAMIMGGFMSGVITPSNNTLTDMPIKLAGTSAKTSWFNKTGSANIALNAATALEVSSNSYMMQLAMKEGGMKYVSGGAIDLDPSIFTKLRYYFKMFGLGVKTGIDLPGESSGYEGPSKQSNIGSALDLSYGNYDGYTTIQLAQYMSTIANGGYRMRPYIVKQVRGTNKDGSLGAIEYTTKPEVLGTIPATAAEWKIVKEGLYDVVHGSSTYITGKKLASDTPSISGKTGTAETFYKNNSTVTLSFAGYAPSDNPQVVVALAIPGASNSDGGANLTMASQIFKAFWKDVKSSKDYQ